MLQPIVLSGGSGSRLWPLSREQQPKQLLKLFGDFSMLQSTILRLNDFSGDFPISHKPIVVCNQSYRFITAEQLQEIKVSATVMLEPIARNTAPALTVAAFQTLAAGNPDALMLVMPADHLIEDQAAFHAAVSIGIKRATEGALVCFGVVPSKPDVGYGYIKMNRAESANGANPLISFVEKPDAKTAQEYLDTGDYVWNSGIFLMKAQVWLDAVEKLNPKMHKACRAAVQASKVDSDFLRISEAEFTDCPDDSIDYAVMEHAGLGNKHGLTAYVVPMNVGWSDVGAWDAVWDASEKDVNGNVTRGKGSAVFHGATNCMAHAASKRLVTVLGLEDVVVIDTADAVMIAHKNALPDLKNMVLKVKDSHLQLTKHWRQVIRPWGSYDSIDSGENFQVKRIIVNPGQVLSLQMHHHRAEHWIVVKGTGKITKGEETFLLSENQSTYIPIGMVHRLENPGKFPLEMIEVQSGSYLGEDDIIRLEDVYGRVETAALVQS